MLDFTSDQPTGYRCFYKSAWRTMTFLGRCAYCYGRCYQFDDGDNDPRGPLGDNAAVEMLAADYGYSGKPILVCFYCHNTDPRHRSVIRAAERSGQWKRIR
jgi:hypothetical protein